MKVIFVMAWFEEVGYDQPILAHTICLSDT